MLRFATANNYAKSIFLAAQQNLTELRSDGGLGPVRSATGASEIPGVVTTFPDEYRAEYVYTVTGTEAFERVLPAGSVDAELRNDQITRFKILTVSNITKAGPKSGNWLQSEMDWKLILVQTFLA